MSGQQNGGSGPALEKDEIPTLVFGGRSHLPHATALIIALNPDPAQARAWLAAIMPEITYGHSRVEQAVVVAFTAPGLLKLGLTESDLAGFPVAFQSGMTSPGRSRVLGDTGDSAPEHWRWGGPENPCDAVLLLYTGTQPALDALRTAHIAGVTSQGGTIMDNIELEVRDQRDRPREQRRMREPFGFVDGISQPILQGTPQAAGQPEDSATAAGAFILGYQGPSGYQAISPQIAPRRDPAEILPTARDAYGVAFRDLGRNGSFLVVRQLEQDVPGFNKFLNTAAADLTAQGVGTDIAPADRPEWVAAKLVGRWRNGASLVRNPGRPGRGPDNKFMFAAEDPSGTACPIGAHIRRSNPRDSLTDDPEMSKLITGRHRLLRVGRPYVPKSQGNHGILFMCLNADIEMQFEMVQQSWMNRPDFRGLRNEPDPLTAGRYAARDFTVPSRDGPGRLRNLPDFVTVIGGAYFFMPSRAAIRYLVSEA